MDGPDVSGARSPSWLPTALLFVVAVFCLVGIMADWVPDDAVQPLESIALLAVGAIAGQVGTRR